jgi:hypothetical protein
MEAMAIYFWVGGAYLHISYIIMLQTYQSSYSFTVQLPTLKIVVSIFATMYLPSTPVIAIPFSFYVTSFRPVRPLLRVNSIESHLVIRTIYNIIPS